MTIGEYIVEKLSLWSVIYSDALIEAELSKLNLIATEEYASNNAEKVDLFFYNILPEMLLMPENVREGGYSISYDKKTMESYYSLLSQRLGMPNLLPKPTITDISNEW